METALSCTNLCCHREQWNPGLSRVVDVSLELRRGQLHGFVGTDGCGKGLLLHMLGLLETPDSGSVRIAGAAVPDPASEEHLEWRTRLFGYLFPSPCLLPSLSVAENVAMPLFRACNLSPAAARDATRTALAFAGVAELENAAVWKLPETLRHRVSLARAIAHRPQIVVAVSPATGGDLQSLLRACGTELGMTVLWSGGHNLVAPVADRLIGLRDGRVVE